MGSIPGSPGAAEIARLKRQGGYEPGLAWMESLVPSENKLPPSDHFSRGLQLSVTHPSACSPKSSQYSV